MDIRNFGEVSHQAEERKEKKRVSISVWEASSVRSVDEHLVARPILISGDEP